MRRLGPTTTKIAVVVLLVAVLLLVRAFVAVPVRIASASMEPTLRAGEVVLVSQRRPDIDDVERGDLVSFRSPEDGERAIKRVVGLPGDSVVIKDAFLYVNDERVSEPYVEHELVDGYFSRTFVVPEDAVFLLGDNRGNSVDSRDYGAIPAEELLGRVLVHL